MLTMSAGDLPWPCHRLRHRLGRLDDADLEGLVALASLGDAEVHPGAGLQARHTLGQRRGGDEDVAAVVVGDEAEALLHVVPLHLARGHRDLPRRGPVPPDTCELRRKPTRNPAAAAGVSAHRSRASSRPSRAARWVSSQAGNSASDVEHDVRPGGRAAPRRRQPPVVTPTPTTPAAWAPSMSWTWSPTNSAAPCSASTGPLPGPHTSPTTWSTSSPSASTCSRALGVNFPVTTRRPPPVTAYGGQRLVGAGERRGRRHRDRRVERSELRRPGRPASRPWRRARAGRA